MLPKQSVPWKFKWNKPMYILDNMQDVCTLLNSDALKVRTCKCNTSREDENILELWLLQIFPTSCFVGWSTKKVFNLLWESSVDIIHSGFIGSIPCFSMVSLIALWFLQNTQGAGVHQNLWDICIQECSFVELGKGIRDSHV